MQQTKICSNIRYFGKLWRLPLNFSLARSSVFFLSQTFPSLLLSLVPSLIFPVLHAEMISISELMRFSWTKNLFTLNPRPLHHRFLHKYTVAILCQFQHNIPSAEMHTISDVYNWNKHLSRIGKHWKRFTFDTESPFWTLRGLMSYV